LSGIRLTANLKKDRDFTQEGTETKAQRTQRRNTKNGQGLERVEESKVQELKKEESST